MGSTLTANTGSQVRLINGAKAASVQRGQPRP